MDPAYDARETPERELDLSAKNRAAFAGAALFLQRLADDVPLRTALLDRLGDEPLVQIVREGVVAATAQLAPG